MPFYFQSENQGEYEKPPSVLNVLTSEGKIKTFPKGKVLSYGVLGAEEAERIRGLLEQCLVPQEIERAGNKGIWACDLKTHATSTPQICARIVSSERIWPPR
ncbi:DNA-directed RNA polymerase iii subunit [Globisporangium polare]